MSARQLLGALLLVVGACGDEHVAAGSTETSTGETTLGDGTETSPTPVDTESTGMDTSTDESSTDESSTDESSTGDTTDDTSTDESSTESEGPLDCGLDPPPASLDLCDRVVAGPAGGGLVASELAAAHASVRFFAPVTAMAEVDGALAAALEPPADASQPDLDTYAATLPEIVCALAAEPDVALGPVQVEQVGDVAFIRPGTGLVVLPPDVNAVAVDLRDLPSGDPALAATLDAAVASALASPVDRYPSAMRHWDGLLDEVFSANNVYSNSIVEVPAVFLLGTGAEELPLVLLTEAAMPAEAVEIAVTMRARGRASVFGEDLLVAAAETAWVGVGAAGISYRYRTLGGLVDPLADIVPADVRAEDPACLIMSSADVPPVPEPYVDGPDVRATFEALDGFEQAQDPAITIGRARAALVSFRGALSRFFPPYPTQDLDARLQEALALVDDAPMLDRPTVRTILRRFANALDDGHAFVFDPQSPTAGYFLVVLEDIDGEAVVRRSGTPGVSPGDTITSIGGVPAGTWFANEMATTSAASDGYRFLVASRRFVQMDGPIDFGLRDPDGVETVVPVQPQPSMDYNAFGAAPSLRASGYLGDLGAPSTYYLNLTREVTFNMDQVYAALTEAQGATGMILDMRGYPGINHYELAQRLIPFAFQSPQFHVPIWDGPFAASVGFSQYDIVPLMDLSFDGPIVLLVGHGTVSAAENFSTMLVDAGVVTVVGRSSAATNGNITGVQLPSGFAMSFTGMEVLHADGSDFHGIGIVPDVPVQLSAADFRDGIDPELEAAIGVLP
jgi:hypothetical protein